MAQLDLFGFGKEPDASPKKKPKERAVPKGNGAEQGAEVEATSNDLFVKAEVEENAVDVGGEQADERSQNPADEEWNDGVGDNTRIDDLGKGFGDEVIDDGKIVLNTHAFEVGVETSEEAGISEEDFGLTEIDKDEVIAVEEITEVTAGKIQKVKRDISRYN